MFFISLQQFKNDLTVVENLKNEFEEADHRVFHHASTVAPNSNVVIRTRDTDLEGILEKLFK